MKRKIKIRETEGTAVTTMRLPVELVEALDIRAQQRRVSRTKFLTDLLWSAFEDGPQEALRRWNIGPMPKLSKPADTPDVFG